MNVDKTNLPVAGLTRRLIALIYDGFLMLGITFAYAVFLRLITHAPELETPQYSAFSKLLVIAGWWACLSAYFCWSWIRRGQTLGMKTWRLCLVGDNGAHPTWGQCWLRCALAPVSLLVFGLGYLWCLLSADGNCWHDLWTRTRVVVLPKPMRTTNQGASSGSPAQ